MWLMISVALLAQRIKSKSMEKTFFVFVNELFQGRRMVPNDFQSGIFPIRNEILMMMILNKRLC